MMMVMIFPFKLITTQTLKWNFYVQSRLIHDLRVGNFRSSQHFCFSVVAALTAHSG